MIYFITGIDTDAGKSIVTGAMGRYLKEKGENVITQKMTQTGCEGISEDILTHRRLMKMNLLPEDINGLTCPYVFHFPSSPHLAARLSNSTIDTSKINEATDELAKRFEKVLVEGAGGLMVPLNDEILLIDYLKERNYPIVLVTSAKVGSINHTLMSLEACKTRQLNVIGLVFNHINSNNKIIAEDSLSVFRKRLSAYYPDAKIVEMDVVTEDSGITDFSELM